VKQVRATGVSMMPEGFEAAFTPQDLADLIAFIKSSTGPRKEFAGNAPALVRPSPDGSLLLPATKAEIYGEQIAFEGEFKNVGMWMSAGDSVAWTARVEKSGDYDVSFDYACAQDSAGNKFRLSTGDHSITGVVASTGPDWSRYRRENVGTLRLSAGEVRVTVRPDGLLHDALIDLRAVLLTPASVAR
jgi:hypothetical protein